jgi:tetratricopeptide (TPR) repeat protein/transcriptional regulator with XRE-family HTH domain
MDASGQPAWGGTTAERRDEFADVLRQLRTQARLTQQELADASSLSLRTVSDLERGAATFPRRETVRLLGDALGLIGAQRVWFETAARGRPPADVPPAGTAAVTRSLPRDVASFTGRQRELAQLTESAQAASGLVEIHAIGGMAGVGKTAFAVHVAHQLAGRFPGGQIFLPLHGHTPGQAPVDPADALATLLLRIEVPPGQIPPGQDARSSLWRDQLSRRALLLVLDDAAGSEQVRPLLPGAGGSLVLVTSRRHLSALNDATAISLDTLPPEDAAALLVRLANRPGLAPGDPGVGEITRLCGFLPLAIGMVARQLRHHPVWSAAARAAELASARDRLGLMETENLSVAAAFDLSYTDLTPDQQRLFRLLGLHPGPDCDAYAAAALAGLSLPAARRGLEALYDQYLLTEPAQGRYRLHDLLREHARALASRVDQAEDRDAATAQLLDYYQHAATVANVRIRARRRPGSDAGARKPAAFPVLASLEQALAWVRVERADLLACLDYAAATGQQDRVVALTAAVSGILQYDGPYVDGVARHTAAIQAARQLGDALSQANALSDLARVRQSTGQYPAAAQDLNEALVLYRDLGDRLGEAHALGDLGDLRYLAGDYPAAVQNMREGLGLYRDLGDRQGQADALHTLGVVLRMTGEYPEATQALDEAMGIYRDLDDRLGEANVLTFLGMVHQLTDDYPAAVPPLREALSLYRDLGNRLGEANALNFLGIVLRKTGDYPASAQATDDARDIYRDISDPGGEAMVLNERGTLHRVSGELALAAQCHRQSLELSRSIDSAWDEAHALAGLGRCAQAGGDTAQAVALLRQALEIFQRIGAAEAPQVAAELSDYTRPQ